MNIHTYNYNQKLNDDNMSGKDRVENMKNESNKKDSNGTGNYHNILNNNNTNRQQLYFEHQNDGKQIAIKKT